MREKLMLFILIGLLLSPTIIAACTVTLDKEQYFSLETITAEMMCDTSPEKSSSYILNWTNASGNQVEIDSEITPSLVGQNFYQTYDISSTYSGKIFANLTVNGAYKDGTEANITTMASSNSLVITNHTFGGGYIGNVGSIKAEVKDENGKKVSGGFCRVSTLSNDESKIILTQETKMLNGKIEVSEVMPVTRFTEGTDYAYEILCYCGSDGGNMECIDEEGAVVEDSVGNTKGYFTTLRWLNVNTVVDKGIYRLKDEIFVCANVTNVNYTSRIPMHIYYQIRCSKGTDNYGDKDRIVIDYNKEDDPSARGVSSNTTQMQCMKFVIPEEKYLMGSESECYASTNVWVLNSNHQEIIGYSTTSPVFNITSTELNLDPDWQWIGDKKINTIINLSEFRNMNGSGIGEIDIRITDSITDRIYMKDSIELFNLIENITVKNSSSTLTEHINYEIEFLEDGQLEIEIRDVALTSTGVEWYNITLDFYDLNLREVEALEGIENKTGTFHLDINCPSEGQIGEDMTCTITAYIEDSQTIQKEVDFTCYINNGISQYSSVNFNQMITQTSLTMNKEFFIPETFIDGNSYILQCHADYYNLGSRRDSFYDTFTARKEIFHGGSSSGGGITGGAITGEGEETGKTIGEGIIDIINKFNPLRPDRNWAFIFIEIIALMGIIIMITIAIKKRKHRSSNQRLNDRLNQTGKIILILIGILIFIGTLIYLYKNISLINISSDIIQDPLFRDMALILFVTLISIIIFKGLKIRGEIRFGEDDPFQAHKEDKRLSRLQNKINQALLKQELKDIKNNKEIKIRKLSDLKRH